MAPIFREITTATGRVWVRVDGRNVAAMDWDRDTTQTDIDRAVAIVAGR